MRKLLNTLYITTQGVYLSKEGETLLVTKKREKLAQIPLLNLQGIVCFGNVLASPFLLGACANHDIGICFLSNNGRFLGRFNGCVRGNVILRRQQYRYADNSEICSTLSAQFLLGKILNSRVLLQRFLRNDGESLSPEAVVKFENAINEFKQISKKIYHFGSSIEVDKLRGFEGILAARYFELFPNFIKNSQPSFSFNGRIKRPPTDPINAMLSYLYTILAHDVASALESVGLDPAVGYLHKDRSGRMSLALDLMEELRGYLVDRLVISTINLKQLSPKDFRYTESGAVLLNDEAKKLLIHKYQDRKQKDIIHPYLQEKLKLGLLPFVQSLLLSRYIRGDIPMYPPFLIR